MDFLIYIVSYQLQLSAERSIYFSKKENKRKNIFIIKKMQLRIKNKKSTRIISDKNVCSLIRKTVHLDCEWFM